MALVKLPEVASVIRSKNSGPYELTLDVIFKNKEAFEAACRAQVINKSTIAKLYGISEDEVIGIIEFAPAHAIKATIVRPFPSGALGETDVYGAQQHAPLLNLEFELT
ncbi:hypothetical protein Desca_1400 [Desulfotomaculum nigrificans CO-1-SRB]|uniref:DUF4387 domain-containing protein n=1 Tax=Desulfotomaculum nigrificans (strain DSM 14880 / VKM B-2319 / CO-1-SRB) TaxID=868595 RepID=F6B5D5_DESCC|nr:DUF4387 domain-containing protein [Desulfotomaculum nigrificans]AEF94256.1 hypothetical protein Desca_1400 [Desulfotomaculum nigrificans CO-1-SRB]